MKIGSSVKNSLLKEELSLTERKKIGLKMAEVSQDELEHLSSCPISNVERFEVVQMYTQERRRNEEGRCEYDYYTGLSLN